MRKEQGRGSCITLIGMPASGKSTVGVVLAKRLGMRFIDTDLVIQEETGKRLKDLIAEQGDDGFRETENRINASLQAENAVIAPGGSAVYGKEAMAHFRALGPVVYLKVPYPVLRLRIGNLKDRGVTMRPGQTFRELFRERTRLYEKYADITVTAAGIPVQQVAERIARIAERMMSDNIWRY